MFRLFLDHVSCDSGCLFFISSFKLIEAAFALSELLNQMFFVSLKTANDLESGIMLVKSG